LERQSGWLTKKQVKHCCKFSTNQERNDFTFTKKRKSKGKAVASPRRPRAMLFFAGILPLPPPLLPKIIGSVYLDLGRRKTHRNPWKNMSMHAPTTLATASCLSSVSLCTQDRQRIGSCGLAGFVPSAALLSFFNLPCARVQSNQPDTRSLPSAAARNVRGFLLLLWYHARCTASTNLCVPTSFAKLPRPHLRNTLSQPPNQWSGDDGTEAVSPPPGACPCPPLRKHMACGARLQPTAQKDAAHP